MHNIYYNPEAFGLVQVAEIDYSSGSYEYDTRVVWKDREGRFWTDRESGCSCPTPFEDKNLSNIDELLSIDMLRDEIHGELSKPWSIYISPEKGQDFLRTVELAMKEG